MSIYFLTIESPTLKAMGNTEMYGVSQPLALFVSSRPRCSSGNANNAGRSSAMGAAASTRQQRRDFLRGMADAKKGGTGPKTWESMGKS